MRALADRAREFLDVRRGLWIEDDAEAVGRARGILGADDFETRLDDSEREYVRDAAGRFSSAGAAADSAAEHAEVARAADRSTSSSSARSRARKAEESAALARVAADHGDHAEASRHAADAERHAQAAVKHSGLSEWTVRERVGALREVERAKTTSDPVEMARAHTEAARAFGVTSREGREHVREAARHSSDVKVAPRQMRVGVSTIAGDDTPKPPPEPEKPHVESPLERLARRKAELRDPNAPARDRQVTFGATDDEHGRQTAENARRMARESVAKERKEALDRQITAQFVTAKVVSLPPVSVVKLPSAGSRLVSHVRRAFGRSDSVDTPTSDEIGSSMSPHESLRAFLQRRYGVDATRLDEAELVRRCSALLGPVESTSTSGTVVVLAMRADAEFNEEDHPRDEGGKFASAGGGTSAKAVELTGSARNGAEHMQAAIAHSKAASESSNPRVAELHRQAADAHREAQTAVARHKSARGPSASQSARRSIDRATEAARSASSQIASLTSSSTGVSQRHEERARSLSAQTIRPSTALAPKPAPPSGVDTVRPRPQQMNQTPEHVVRATAAAQEARTAASGTSPAARASARKAAESAALAKVAHEHGDVEGARRHSENAMRHVEATMRKVDEHGGSSKRSRVNTTNMGENARNASVARAAADRATANAKTPTDHMIASAMRDAAASAERRASTTPMQKLRAEAADRQGEARTAGGGHSDQHLAEIVNRHAQEAPSSSRFAGGREVYSSEVYDRMSSTDRAKFGTLDQFKDKLIHLNREGHIQIGRIDSRGDADADKLAKSHINSMQAPGGRHVEGPGANSFVSHTVVDRTKKF